MPVTEDWPVYRCGASGHAWRSAALYDGTVFDVDVCFTCGEIKLLDRPNMIISGELREVEDVPGF